MAPSLSLFALGQNGDAPPPAQAPFYFCTIRTRRSPQAAAVTPIWRDRSLNCTASAFEQTVRSGDLAESLAAGQIAAWVNGAAPELTHIWRFPARTFAGNRSLCCTGFRDVNAFVLGGNS
jgi:hypothetical protein